ncbi:MAG TPA: hypothetical protein VGE07_26900 [Herpetosiphonaceae bacterium]
MAFDKDLFPWEFFVVVAAILGLLTIISLVRWIFNRPQYSGFPVKRVVFVFLCLAMIAAPYQLVDQFPAKMRSAFSQSAWSTNDTPFYPELATPRFPLPRDQVYPTALKLARDEGWEIVSESASAGTLFIKIPVLFGIYTDELRVAMIDEGPMTRVDLQASSERAKTDMGAGRRHIMTVLKGLEQELGVTRSTTLAP